MRNWTVTFSSWKKFRTFAETVPGYSATAGLCQKMINQVRLRLVEVDQQAGSQSYENS